MRGGATAEVWRPFVVEGLKACAWVSHRRYEMRQEGQHLADQWLDCNACIRWNAKASRASMACGWLPKVEHTGPPPAPWVGAHSAPKLTVCPGYSTSLPEVHEAVRASQWAERGLLREFYQDEELTPLVFDAIDVINSSSGAVESYMMEKSRRKSGIR